MKKFLLLFLLLFIFISCNNSKDNKDTWITAPKIIQLIEISENGYDVDTISPYNPRIPNIYSTVELKSGYTKKTVIINNSSTDVFLERIVYFHPRPAEDLEKYFKEKYGSDINESITIRIKGGSTYFHDTPGTSLVSYIFEDPSNEVFSDRGGSYRIRWGLFQYETN